MTEAQIPGPDEIGDDSEVVEGAAAASENVFDGLLSEGGAAETASGGDAARAEARAIIVPPSILFGETNAQEPRPVKSDEGQDESGGGAELDTATSAEPQEQPVSQPAHDRDPDLRVNLGESELQTDDELTDDIAPGHVDDTSERRDQHPQDVAEPAAAEINHDDVDPPAPIAAPEQVPEGDVDIILPKPVEPDAVRSRTRKVSPPVEPTQQVEPSPKEDDLIDMEEQVRLAAEAERIRKESEAAQEAAEDDIGKGKRKKRRKAKPKVEPTPTVPPTTPEAPASTVETPLKPDSDQNRLDEDEVRQAIKLAERLRFLDSIKDAAKKKVAELLDDTAQTEAVEKWVEENPREVSPEDFEAYVSRLTRFQLEKFLQLEAAEQDNLIKNVKLAREAAEEKAKDATTEEAPRVKTKEATPKTPERIPPISAIHKRTVVEAFIKILGEENFKTFSNLPEEERDLLIQEWIVKGSQELLNNEERERFNSLSDESQGEYIDYWQKTRGIQFNELSERFLAGLNKDQKESFRELSYDEKIKNLLTFEQGGDPPGYKSSTETYNGRDGLEAPSYRTYGIYSTGTEEEYFQVITEHDLQHNARSKKELKRERNFWQRAKLTLAGIMFTVVLKTFNYEEKLAQENKHNQEMIRGIVDTGPDEYERLIFAQKHGGVYLNYEGKEVSAEVVRRAQKWALHNPARFQALCHYELSKREEPEQAALWEEIFEMMAHHHYNKYAMFGVVVGLQFMNKPQYLAYKNAKIEWMPIYEEEHGEAVRDENNRPRVKKWTEENAYEHRFGRRVLKKDGDGKNVVIGETMRSTQRARFKTVELRLQPGDQEYDEKVADPSKPGAFKDKYETRYDVIRDPETNEILRRDAYKVKMIIELKHDKFAHELGGKFMSFQYGFRSADVALMLDEARLAAQTATKLIRAGNVHSPEFQIALYTLSRYKFVVDSSRLSGGGSPESAGEAGAEMLREEYQKAQQIRLDIKAAKLQSENPGLTQKQAYEAAEADLKERGGYPAKIPGTAEANVLFLELADLVDEMAKRFTNITKIRKSDYEAVQKEFYSSSHGGHGGGHGSAHRPEHGLSRREARRRRRQKVGV